MKIEELERGNCIEKELSELKEQVSRCNCGLKSDLMGNLIKVAGFSIISDYKTIHEIINAEKTKCISIIEKLEKEFKSL